MNDAKTANRFCVPGRFWTTMPQRERTEEERETLRELAELVMEEEADDAEALATWLAS